MISSIVTEGGLRLVIDRSGDPSSTPVILLHGGGQTRHTWRATREVLARSGYFAVAYDARGHGESGWALDADYSLDAYVRDLRTLARTIGRKPTLVGASLGGLISLLAVGEKPVLAASALVLLDVTPSIDTTATARIVAFMRSHPEGFESIQEAAGAVAHYQQHRAPQTPSANLERNLRKGAGGRLRWHWDPQILGIDGQAQSMAAERLEAAARNVSIPTLLVRGAESDVVPEHAAARFRELLPSTEQVNIPGAAHMIVGDNNDIANHVLLDFLRRNL
jgi:pimeloyl-ACP methyl ester carboxylesterase